MSNRGSTTFSVFIFLIVFFIGLSFAVLVLRIVERAGDVPARDDKEFQPEKSQPEVMLKLKLCVEMSQADRQLPPPQRALLTWKGFKDALRANDLDRTVSCFSPHVQDQFRTILSERNLPEMAESLSDLTLANLDPGSSNNFVQYEFESEGELFAVTFNCGFAHGVCLIMGI